MADNDDKVTLGLGGSNEETDDDAESEPEPMEERLVGTSGRALSGARELGADSRLLTPAR